MSRKLFGCLLAVIGAAVVCGCVPPEAFVSDPSSGNVYEFLATVPTNINTTITVGGPPTGVAVTRDSSKVYVTNLSNNTVSVIATASNTVVATISDPTFLSPRGVAVAPNGSAVYVANPSDDTVTVIDPASNTVTGSILLPVNSAPIAVAVTPDSSMVYVLNFGTHSVLAIDTATNTVIDPKISVGSPSGITIEN